MERYRYHWEEGQKPKVTVIIPCYNCREYVGEALAGLKNQTCKDFEVICVNDGSADDALRFLQDQLAAMPFPSVIVDQENAGVSLARNAGMAESRGEYIMFCDADDVYHSQKMIELLVAAIEKNDTDTAYCLLSRDRDRLENSMDAQPAITVKGQADAMHDLLYRMGQLGFYCFIYKKEIIINAGLTFDGNTKYFEDREFNWKYLANCKNASFVDAAMYWYRRTENSATTAKKPAWRTDSLDAVDRVGEYLKEKQCACRKEVYTYLKARVYWGLAKTYAISKQIEYFKKLDSIYEGKQYMRITKNDKDFLVAVSSRLYLLHPLLFYSVVQMKKL